MRFVWCCPSMVLQSCDPPNAPLRGAMTIARYPALLLLLGAHLAAQNTRGVEVQQNRGATRLGAYHALLIAVENYADPALPRLDNPVRDAGRLRDVLIQRYQFESRDIAVLDNPTRDSIEASLYALSERLGPDDNLLIFFAGHGHWDEKTQQGYWLPADARRANPARWISNADIRDLIRRIKTQHTLLITDACFSGGIFKTRGADFANAPAMSRLYALRSRKAMTSGAKETVPDNSRFLEYLIKRLDENRAALLPASELFTSLRTAVMNNSPVTPEYGTIFDTEDEGGEFLFPLRDAGAAAARAWANPGGAGSGTAPASPPGGPVRDAGTPPAAVPDTRSRGAGASHTLAESVAAAPDVLVAAVDSRGFDALSGTCRAGAPGDCYAAGIRVLAAHGVPRDDATARDLLAHGCDAGDAASCAEGALLDARDPARSADGTARLRKACDHAEPNACAGLARLWLSQGHGGSPGELLSALGNGCTGGVPAACPYAAIASPGTSGTRLAPAGQTYLDTGCRSGDATSCAFLARLYVERNRSPAEQTLAGRLAEAACALYDPVGCNLLAQQLSFGLGANPDFPRARELAERSCNAHSGEGCFLLGRLHEIGLGVKRDAREASRLFALACRYGVHTDCSHPLSARADIDWWHAVP